MTSRERILKSIAHEQPDRVPVDLGSTPSSNISAIAYNQLKKHLGMTQGKTKIYDVVQQVVMPEEEILDLFGIDVIDLAQEFCQNDEEWYPVTLADGSEAYYPTWFRPHYNAEKKSYEASKNGEVIAHMPLGATFFDQIVFPYVDGYPNDYSDLDCQMGRVLWQAFGHSPWDHYKDESFWALLREKALALRARTDRAIVIVCGCNLFEWGTFLRRMDNFLMDLYIDQDNVERLLDELMKRHLRTLEKVCEAVGDIVDVLRFGDDLGLDTGPFMSPEIYRKLLKPRHKQLCDYVHEHSSMKTFLHSCGSIYKLMPDLIEAGYDVINPVQTTSKDMEPDRLKDEFGSDITFWGGGCNTRSILNMATPEEVKTYTTQMLTIFSHEGGFVFNQEHNIMPDVPPENIVAMYEAIKEFNQKN